MSNLADITLDFLHEVDPETIRELRKTLSYDERKQLDKLLYSPRLPVPQPGPQTDFYHTEADIAVYGGSAGSGKSFALLLDFARSEFISNPKYNFVIFRRETGEVTQPGSLWDTSLQVFPMIGGVSRQNDHSWKFKSGCWGRFAHLQHEKDKYTWKGAQVNRIGFDELTTFTEGQFFYLLSRARSMSGIPAKIRATTNPQPGWVKTFLGPWVDKNYPQDQKAKSGELRWFIRDEDTGAIRWVDKDYMTDDGIKPMSVTFIRASIYDNKKMLAVSNEYLTKLKSLDLVEQRRLLHGDWDAMDGAFFEEFSEPLHCCPPLFRPPTEDGPLPPLPGHWEFFAGLDWGYSARGAMAFVLLGLDERGTCHLIDSIHITKITNAHMATLICGMLAKWGLPLHVPIACDPSMWNQTQTKWGWNGEKNIEAFWRAGLSGVLGADNSRVDGWSQVRNFLHMPGAFKIWRANGSNEHLIKLFPTMEYSKTKLNDMATDGDDHLHDSLRYALMTRPEPAKPVKLAPVDYLIHGKVYQSPSQLPHALTPEPIYEEYNSW